MKNHWYLVSSLPYLRFGEKPPMERAAFLSACASWLTGEEVAVIRAVLEERRPPAGGAAWWNGEVQLRDAVARIRAKKRGIDAGRFLEPHEGFSVAVEKMVDDAFARANPLEQEMELDRARWTLAEEIALSEPFGFVAVLAFAVKLRISERWAAMNEENGRENVEALISAATESLEQLTGN